MKQYINWWIDEYKADMNTALRYMMSSLLAAIPFLASAQIDPTVEVEREYDVKLVEIDKPQLSMTEDSGLRKFNVNFDYEVFEMPYGDLYDFVPGRFVQLEKPSSPKYRNGYVKAGLQYPWLPSAEVALQKVTAKGFSFGASATHRSAFEPMAFPAADYDISSLLSTDASISGKYSWKGGAVALGLRGYDRRGRWYNTSVAENPLGNRSDRIGADFSIGSKWTASDGFIYNVEISADRLLSAVNVPEGTDTPAIRQDGETGLSGNVLIGLRHGRFFYYLEACNTSLWTSADDASMFSLAPQVEFHYHGLKARLGLSFEHGYMYGASSSYQTAFSPLHPLADLQYELLKNRIWLRGYITGGNSVTSLTSAENSSEWFPRVFANPHYTNKSYDTGLEFKSLVFDRLSINLEAGLARYRSRAFLAFDGCNYRPDYADASCGRLGAQLLWKSKSLSAGGSYYFNSWKRDDGRSATLCPMHRGEAFVRYNYREHIVAQAGFDAQSGVSYGKDAASVADGWWNVHMEVSYSVNRSLSLYARVNNLLNRQLWYAPKFNAPSFNIGGGVEIRF